MSIPTNSLYQPNTGIPQPVAGFDNPVGQTGQWLVGPDGVPFFQANAPYQATPYDPANPPPEMAALLAGQLGGPNANFDPQGLQPVFGRDDFAAGPEGLQAYLDALESYLNTNAGALFNYIDPEVARALQAGGYNVRARSQGPSLQMITSRARNNPEEAARALLIMDTLGTNLEGTVPLLDDRVRQAILAGIGGLSGLAQYSEAFRQQGGFGNAIDPSSASAILGAGDQLGVGVPAGAESPLPGGAQPDVGVPPANSQGFAPGGGQPGPNVGDQGATTVGFGPGGQQGPEPTPIPVEAQGEGDEHQVAVNSLSNEQPWAYSPQGLLLVPPGSEPGEYLTVTGDNVERWYTGIIDPDTGQPFNSFVEIAAQYGFKWAFDSLMNFLNPPYQPPIQPAGGGPGSQITPFPPPPDNQLITDVPQEPGNPNTLVPPPSVPANGVG